MITRTNSQITIDSKPKNPINIESWKKIAKDSGINLNASDLSEHQYRFNKQTENNQRTFVLNPQPNVDRFNRPFSKALIEPLRTEYTDRYQYPDSNKIDKFPWRKT